MIVIPIASGVIALVTVFVLCRAKREVTRPGLLPRVIALALISPTCSVVAGVYRFKVSYPPTLLGGHSSFFFGSLSLSSCSDHSCPFFVSEPW